jgi:hypothetical protein
VSGKYEPIRDWLGSQTDPFVTLTFEQVEAIIRAPLPRSARVHEAWWGNNDDRHVQTRAWLDAGLRSTDLDLERRLVVFQRTG